MTTQQKNRVVLYGILLSIIHFAAVGLCHGIPTLLMRPEDMSAPQEGKPTWPRYRLKEALERVGDVLRIPFDWVWTPWMSQHMPDAVAVLFMVLTSSLWGFGLVLALGLVFGPVQFGRANAA